MHKGLKEALREQAAQRKAREDARKARALKARAEGMTYPEIAELVGVHATTVKVWCDRARKAAAHAA
jgi:transposase